MGLMKSAKFILAFEQPCTISLIFLTHLQIVSLVLLASGLVLKFFPHNDYIKSTEDQLKAALKTLLEGTGSYKRIQIIIFVYLFVIVVNVLQRTSKQDTKH